VQKVGAEILVGGPAVNPLESCAIEISM
jgi:hypothetical protein